jgi:hypothetical protein
MTCERRSSDASLYVCTADGCGRMLQLHRGGALEVISRGDPSALHGSGVGLQLAIAQD